MAEIKKLCPFSGGLCKECPIFRARHHYLCSRNNDRGNLCKPGELSDIIAPPTTGPSRNNRFEIPHI